MERSSANRFTTPADKKYASKISVPSKSTARTIHRNVTDYSTAGNDHAVGQETSGGRPIAPADELAGKLESLLTRAQELGMLTTTAHIPSQAERMLATEIRDFLPTVEQAIDNGSAQHIILLHSLYDLAYRISLKRAPSKELLPRLFTRAITLWLKGDKSVGEEDLIAMLQHIDPRCVDFKYIDWSISVQDKWIKELEANNGRFLATLAPTLAQKRLQILLHANLWTYFGDKEEEIKRGWKESIIYLYPHTHNIIHL